jgi:hypothetical protein
MPTDIVGTTSIALERASLGAKIRNDMDQGRSAQFRQSSCVLAPQLQVRKPGYWWYSNSKMEIRHGVQHASKIQRRPGASHIPGPIQPPQPPRNEPARCYIRDPDGYLIKVGQTTEPQGDWWPADWPPINPAGQSD